MLLVELMQTFRILQQNLKPSARLLNLGRNWVFQEDNDPKHTGPVSNQYPAKILLMAPIKYFSFPNKKQ